MKLDKENIRLVLEQWNEAWNRHDLETVMQLFHDDILFENWTGAKVKGKAALAKAWQHWFENHGDFRFIEEDTFIDAEAQKVLFRWTLEWPSIEPGHEGKPEIRRGVDLLYFQDGKIIEKLTYSKTSIEIEGQRHSLKCEK